MYRLIFHHDISKYNFFEVVPPLQTGSSGYDFYTALVIQKGAFFPENFKSCKQNLPKLWLKRAKTQLEGRQ